MIDQSRLRRYLGSSQVTDSGLEHIAHCTELRVLHLHRTAITDRDWSISPVSPISGRSILEARRSPTPRYSVSPGCRVSEH